jgi:hypothetical protein
MTREESSPKNFYSYCIGDIVQVRSGIKDLFFPDITIGGWVGEITDVEREFPNQCTIRWTQETLRLMPPVFKEYCVRYGFHIEEMRLDYDSIELFDGDSFE